MASLVPNVNHNNSTTTNWSVNGVSLQTYAWNISSWGDKEIMPPTRGSNLLIPYATGQTWVSKVPDSRTITLAMWVTGANPDGSIPKGLARAQFESNYTALRNLFWSIRKQLTLSKLMIYPDGSTKAVTAKAEYVGGLQPQMQGTTGAGFTVDLLLADPFFYGPEITQTVAPTTGMQILGDDRTENIVLTVKGPRNTLRVQAQQPDGTQVWFQYNYNIPTGDTIVADVRNFQITHTHNGASYQAAGRVNHGNSDPYWLYLTPGYNTVTASGSSGNGSITLSYLPRWI